MRSFKPLILRLWPYLSIIIVYVTLFLPTIHGIGQYWDWSFPVFKSDMPNLYDYKSASWNESGQGSILGYSSDIYLRYAISHIPFLQPEYVRYVLLVAIFSLGTYFMYKISVRKLPAAYALLVSFLVLINPAIFYKLTAGHFNYIFSFTIFIGILFVLIRYGNNTYVKAVLLGIALAIVGAQIQFFFFTAFLFLLFSVIAKNNVHFRFIVVSIIIGVLLHAIWILPFLVTGSGDVVAIAANAKVVSVARSMRQNYIDTFTLVFSQATQLSNFMPKLLTIFCSFLFPLAIIPVVQHKSQKKKLIILLVLLLLLVLLSTGIYNSLQIPLVSLIYPMFREVGHFAPLVVLVLATIIVISFQGSRNWYRLLMPMYLLIFVVINGIFYFGNFQTVDLASFRKQTSVFHANLVRLNKTDRVLYYPFFDQYSIRTNTTQMHNNHPLTNSGHDSLFTFSGVPFVSNVVNLNSGENSLQVDLLNNYQLDKFIANGVTYIYDLSGVYKSNITNFIPAHVIDKDPVIGQQRSDFFNDLITANPNTLSKIAPGIFKIQTPQKQVMAFHNLLQVGPGEQLTSDDYRFATSVAPTAAAFRRLGANARQDELNYKSLFRVSNINLNDGTLTQKLPKSKHTWSIYGREDLTDINYSFVDGKLVLDARPPGAIVGISKEKNVETFDHKYVVPFVGSTGYISNAGSLIRFSEGSVGQFNLKSANKSIILFRGSQDNVIKNSSFDDGLWYPQVGDCNKYDDNPDIGMALIKRLGGRSNVLQLSAHRHNACTEQTVPIQGGKKYNFHLAFNSPNAENAEYTIQFNDQKRTVISQNIAINSNDWEDNNRIIDAPTGATTAKVYLYANEHDGVDSTVNNYDDLSLTELEDATSYTLNSNDQQYRLLGQANAIKQQDIKYQTGKPLTNIIENYSFEKSLWQAKVGDCNRYDNNAEISMTRDTSTYSDGKASLRLASVKHSACSSLTVNVDELQQYLLSIDYRTSKGGQAAYNIVFNNTKIDQEYTTVTGKNDKWNTISKNITIPKNATTMTVYLYAPEEKGMTNIVNYDNVKTYILPNVRNNYFAVRDDVLSTSHEPIVDYVRDSSTRYTVHASKINAAFFLKLNDNYHTGWELQSINGANVKTSHIKVDDYANGWYVDATQICKDDPVSCHKNVDGSSDISFIITFLPQRYFVLGRSISACIMFLSTGFILISIAKKKLKKELHGKSLRHSHGGIRRQ